MIKAVEYLSRYPYGCLEQTINKFIPILAMQKLIASGKYSNAIPDELKKNLTTMIPEGIRRLENAQNSDGTWGWWEGDRGNVYITGFVISSLFNARGFGYKVDDEVLKNGQYALSRIFDYPEKMSGNELSYLTYIYSLYKKFDSSIFKRVAYAKELNAYQAANLIKAANNLKGAGVLSKSAESEVNEALKLLNKKIEESSQRDSCGIYWSAASGRSWDWPGSNTEITAHVLSALVSSGDKSPKVSQTVASISKRFKDGYWGSTKESGTVILALCDYFTSNSMDYKEAGEIEFSLNGERLEKISYNNNSTSESLKREIKLENKKAESYKLTAAGTDSSHTTYSATLRGILYFKPKGVLSFLKSEKRGIEELSNGVTARREISFLNRVKDMKMQEYLVPQNLDDKSKINVGDELLVRIKFKASDKFGYMILQDFLPAGFEVVKESAYNEYQSYSHVERRDNRMVFFFTDIAKDREYEVAYIMRAELPGTFMMRPARIECMYEESIQGWSSPNTLDVQDEKKK